MLDRDGVYLEGVQVGSAEDIALNYQANDLTRPTTLQLSYSDSFSFPDSLAVRKLTQHAEQLDSASRFARKPIGAKVIGRGETVFEGIAELSSFDVDAGWSAALYEQKRNLFDRLERSLRSLQLSHLDHPWTLEQISALASSTGGICYPLIDYGLLQTNIIPYEVMLPAVFVKTLMAQMLDEEGYTLVGDILDDEVFKRLLIPFSEEEPTSHDKDWSDDRFARVTLSIPDDSVTRGALGSGNFLDRIQPFSIDNIDTFYQGNLHPFNTTTFEYICPDSMHLRVQPYQIFKAQCLAGGTEIILSVEKNGVQVASKRMDFGAGYNLFFLRPDRIELDTTVTCKRGDRIRIRLEARRFTQVGAYKFEIYNNSENSACSFTPSLTTAFGDDWNTARNLCDVTCLELLKAVAFVMEGIWLVDARKKQVSFSSLTAITQNRDNALDWSSRLDTGGGANWSPRLAPYAQSNQLAWRETTESKALATMVGSIVLNYGDGIIEVNDPALELLQKLFDLPFGASTDSDKDLPGYGAPVLIKIRSVSGSGSNLTINKQGTEPRLLLASLGDAYPVQTTRLIDDSDQIETITVPLRPCWFGFRPYPLVSTEPALSLSFATPVPGRGEIGLIDRYYAGLKRVLRRMRVLTVSMRLKPTDVASLDFRKPIRLQRTSLGGLVLSDGCYVLNKVEGYSASGICKVTLIAYD